MDQLIRIPTEDVERLITEHAKLKCLQFGSDEMIALCMEAFEALHQENVNLS